MRDWIYDHIYAILATVIFHLVLAILFMLIKLHSLPEERDQPILITFEETPPPPQEENQEKLAPDPELQQMLHNIPVNEASRAQETFDWDKYIDRVKEEMIKEGKLGRDNFIDEQKRQRAETEKELTVPLPLKGEGNGKEDSLLQAALEAAKYKGPTRVKYNLPGRYAVDLVIPIYKCEGSGTVVVKMTVDREGKVVNAMIDPVRSADSPCMHTTALNAVRRSRFNPDPDAPESQQGTVTFYFVPQ